MQIRLSVLFALTFLVVLPTQADVPQQDDRYAGYPAKITWPANEPDMEACVIGEYYSPKGTRLYQYLKKFRFDERIQEVDECVWMLTTKGYRYVLRPKGTKVAVDDKGRDLFDLGFGEEKVCGNPRPFSRPVAVTLMATPAPAPTFVPTPKATPAPIPTLAPQEVSVAESHWGFTGSATLGAFDSEPVGGLASTFSGRSVCAVRGKSFDVGVARRKQNSSSFWRLTLTGTMIEDGSYTIYTCERCGEHVTTVAQGMRVWGVKGERVQGLGPSHWIVRPAITAHAGVGLVSGSAERAVSSSRGMTRAVVGANKLFGSNFLPIAGAGAGAVWGKKRVTVHAVLIGFAYPGVYYGGVGVTFWP